MYDKAVHLRNSAAADEEIGGDAVLAQALNDGTRAIGGRLDEGAVDLGARRVQRLAEDHPRQARVDEYRAVAVIPVEGDEAGFAGRECGGLRGQLRMEGVPALADPLDPPLQQIADRRL